MPRISAIFAFFVSLSFTTTHLQAHGTFDFNLQQRITIADPTAHLTDSGWQETEPDRFLIPMFGLRLPDQGTTYRCNQYASSGMYLYLVRRYMDLHPETESEDDPWSPLLFADGDNESWAKFVKRGVSYLLHESDYPPHFSEFTHEPTRLKGLWKFDKFNERVLFSHPEGGAWANHPKGGMTEEERDLFLKALQEGNPVLVMWKPTTQNYWHEDIAVGYDYKKNCVVFVDSAFGDIVSESPRVRQFYCMDYRIAHASIKHATEYFLLN